MFATYLLLKVLPNPLPSRSRLSALTPSDRQKGPSLYAMWYAKRLEALVAWHKGELLRLDHSFRLQDATRRLIRAREQALREGIGPFNPAYPDIYDFMGDKK
jgi:hypothetical protein